MPKAITPKYDEETKEKIAAAYANPAGISVYVYPDREGMWHARIECSDGSYVYLRPCLTANGAFRELADNALLFGLLVYGQSLTGEPR